MNPFSLVLEKTLLRNPIQEAEAYTGQSIWDRRTALLSMKLAVEKHLDKQALLEVTGDVGMHCTVQQYLEIVQRFGFDLIYEEEFYSPTWNHKDKYYLLFHQGVLLAVESFQNNVNMAHCYFNWEPGTGDMSFLSRCEGEFVICQGRKIWVGHAFVLEGCLHLCKWMSSQGTLVWPWLKRPYLPLLNYEECREHIKLYEVKDFRGVVEKKLKQLPEIIQQGIPAYQEELK